MSMVLVCKIVIFVAIFLGFYGLLHYARETRIIYDSAKNMYESMQLAEYVRQKKLGGKRDTETKKESMFIRIDKNLVHSGLNRAFPFLNAEIYMLFLLSSGGILFITMMVMTRDLVYAMLGFATVIVVVELVIKALMIRNYKRIDKSLLEFVNLLGNYSLSSGELINALYSVSKYVKSPLKQALEESYYEANTSGNVERALFNLMEKIPHLKFKEFIRNLEVCSRYSTDYSVLISSTRKNLQEYSKSCKERYSMIQEGVINMAILMGMLVLILLAVESMIETSIWVILLESTVGKIAGLIVVAILGLFVRKIIMLEQE